MTASDTPPSDHPADVKPDEIAGAATLAAPPPAETVAAAPAATDEGLPEWEPLTPELVEDEAIRGDFVMKWAVVLLAVLLASTLIAETTTLVHVKTGQMLAAAGGLPPALDPFTATAGNRPWINFSWLFDLLAAGVFAIGQWTGLSVLKAVLAGLTFGVLVRISRPGVSTWWGSVCAALAAVACLPRFTAQPEIITLLGISLTLAIVFCRERGASAKQFWMLAPLFLLWGNLDGRMFIGPLLVGLYALGEFVGSRIGRTAFESSADRKQLWAAFGASLAAAMLNPYGWKWLLAPATLYGSTYPALRAYASSSQPGSNVQYFPVASPQFWSHLDASGILALILCVLTAVTLVLNSRRLDLGQFFLFVGGIALAILGVHELAAASLVFCVVATLNGQAWYKATCSQDYSVEMRALLFSRGGRAITVLGLFAVALLAIVGQLKAPGGAGLGFGLDRELAGVVASYRQQLTDAPPGQAFNFVLSQGDLLIWSGVKPFVDSRVELFDGSGEDDLLGLHRRARESLSRHRQKDVAVGPQEETRAAWEAPFKKYQVTYVLPRLSGAFPDYVSLTDLQASQNWLLVKLGSATAILCRVKSANPELEAYLATHQADFPKQAFREASDPLPPRDGWVELPTFYQKYFWGTERHTTPESQEARHLHLMAALSQAFRPDLAYLAIRKAQLGLTKDRNDPQAYLTLGAAYIYLGNFEKAVLNRQLGGEVSRLRYFQAVSALNEALVADQDLPRAHELLSQLYLSGGKYDLAAREMEALDRLLMQIEAPSENEMRQQQELEEMRPKLQTAIEKIQQDGTARIDKGESPLEVAYFYYQNGCLLKALAELDAHPELLIGQPQVQLLRAMTLIEVGRLEEAYEAAGQLEGAAAESGFREWRAARALTHILHGEYDQAAQTWTGEAQTLEDTAFGKLLGSIPVRDAPPPNNPWPLSLTVNAAEYYFQLPSQTSTLWMSAGLAQLEAGQLPKAIQSLRKALEKNPESADRRLIVFYLSQLTGEEYDILPPSESVPVLFEPEPAAAQ